MNSALIKIDVIKKIIDLTKIYNELGWLPETEFVDGIKKTIQRYLDNRKWWEDIISVEYQNYYEKCMTIAKRRV